MRNVFAWQAYAHFLIGNVCNQSEPEILLIIATFNFLSFSFSFLSFYSITLYHFHLLPYFCWLLVARATCARKHINLIATICCPTAPFAFAIPWPYPTLGYLVFLATSRLISYVSGANGKTQLGCAASFFLAALISYLHRVPRPRFPSPLLTMPCAHFSASACQLPFPFAFFVDTWGRHTAKPAWQARSAVRGVFGMSVGGGWCCSFPCCCCHA